MSAEIPLVLKFDDWPPEDRAAWSALFQSQGFLEDEGAGVSWAEGTRTKRKQGYGHWLSFLARNGFLDRVNEPTQRITPDRARAYLSELTESLGPRSVSNWMTDLYVLAIAFRPEEDWGWLKIAVRRVTNRANRRTLPPSPSIDAKPILDWAIERMEALSCQDVDIATSIEFRQALLAGFLISFPVRRRALISMTVSNHVLPYGSGFHVSFSATDMKDKHARSAPLAKALVPFMERYLAVYRPCLLGKRTATTDALWVTHHGKPFTADGIASDIERTTEGHLKVQLSPHDFRYVAATSIAEVDPEHVGIIRDVLGHATMDMAYKHYNRASGISSCNKLQSILEDIRSSMPIMGRVSNQPTDVYPVRRRSK
jgi:integrase/recombinase XerD